MTNRQLTSDGVIFDRSLSFNEHAENVSESRYNHIRVLRHIQSSLLDDVAKTVACSIVTSRLDYCNAVFAGMFEVNVHKAT